MARQKIREMRKKERSLSEQLRDTANASPPLKPAWRFLNREYQKVAAELRQTRERVLAVRARLSRHRSLLAERLRQLYKHPPADYVLFALSAPDVTEAAMRTYVFRRIVHHDSTMIQATQQTKAELEREMELLRRQQAKLASLRASIAEQARELRQAEAEQTDLLRRIQTERKTYEQWLKEWEEESKAIAALLRRCKWLNAARPALFPLGEVPSPPTRQRFYRFGLRLPTAPDFGRGSVSLWRGHRRSFRDDHPRRCRWRRRLCGLAARLRQHRHH
jgi:peptidoglycan hydrolase CwlO-like protein